MRIFGSVLVGAALATTCGTAQAQDASGTDLSFTTGVDYSSGDYGTGVDTDIVIVPLSARLKSGNLRFAATVPYIRIDGGANVVGGDGGPIIIDPNSPSVRRDGIGDVTLGVNYGVPEDSLGFGLDFGAKVKLPTAESGLGTGKTDLSFSTELSRTFGTVTPYVQVGYRLPGDPVGIDLHNAFYGSAGASFVAGKSVILASYGYREASSDFTTDSHELFAAFSTPVSKALNFTLYGSKGLSEGAADYGVGAMVTIKAF